MLYQYAVVCCPDGRFLHTLYIPVRGEDHTAVHEIVGVAFGIALQRYNSYYCNKSTRSPCLVPVAPVPAL